ncbi:MAG: 50S ribosome-binding GTPase [Oscillospiraceae bacterium]|nr:50S ribosome-binding GTPase [Oscillospiraceae bacterium]
MNRNYRADDIDYRLDIAGFYPLDVLVTGCTGAGKSTTLNSLFEKAVAGVGYGSDPYTMEVSPYLFTKKVRLWDTPGLGDGVESDQIHENKLKDILWNKCTIDNEEYALIDMVLVIVDGTVRDLGTTYHLIRDVIAPNIQTDRILVAVNQADMAMKGRHFDYCNCNPDRELTRFLDEQSESVRRRINEATGVNIERPVYYSAEYNYNVDGFYDYIIDHIPRCRRKLKTIA